MTSIFLGACDSGAPADYQGFLGQWPDAYCEGLFACALTNGWESPLYQRSAYANEAECRTVLGRELSGEYTPVLAKALADGAVRYDAAAAARCLASLRGNGSSACDGAGGNDPSCDQVVVGTRAEGAFCRMELECVGGTTCNDAESGCGRCVREPALPGLGESCSLGYQCQTGLRCAPSSSTDSFTCQPEATVAIAKLGQPCGGTSANVENVCERGTFCDAPSSTRLGVCRRPLTIGQPCDHSAYFGEACEVGSICTSDDRTGTDRCVKVTIHTTIGEVCDPNEDSTDVCSASRGLVCDYKTQRCVSLGDGSAGSSCNYDGDCDAGLICPTDVCMRPLSDGAACEDGLECASGYCFVPTSTHTGTCTELPTASLCR